MSGKFLNDKIFTRCEPCFLPNSLNDSSARQSEEIQDHDENDHGQRDVGANIKMEKETLTEPMTSTTSTRSYNRTDKTLMMGEKLSEEEAFDLQVNLYF